VLHVAWGAVPLLLGSGDPAKPLFVSAVGSGGPALVWGR
jgi:hypothetical protein